MRGIFAGCCASADKQSGRSKVLSAKPTIFFIMMFLLRLLSTLRSLPTALCPLSLDHLVRSNQHLLWNRHADLLRRFQIDDELELRRLLHGEIGGLRAFEDLIHIRSGAPVQVGNAHAVTH